MSLGNLPFVAAALLVILGIYTLLFKRNLVKLIIGGSLIETGVNLLLVTLGYRSGGIAPIYTYAPAARRMVLPTPQALTLTSIVIGMATTALLLSFAVQIYRHHGTLDARKVKELKG
ncbi:MAG: cation:proton antiporter subunit C [Candidatus Bipolaricaulota bacterium]